MINREIINALFFSPVSRFYDDFHYSYSILLTIFNIRSFRHFNILLLFLYSSAYCMPARTCFIVIIFDSFQVSKIIRICYQSIYMKFKFIYWSNNCLYIAVYN